MPPPVPAAYARRGLTRWRGSGGRHPPVRNHAAPGRRPRIRLQALAKKLYEHRRNPTQALTYTRQALLCCQEPGLFAQAVQARQLRYNTVMRVYGATHPCATSTKRRNRPHGNHDHFKARSAASRSCPRAIRKGTMRLYKEAIDEGLGRALCLTYIAHPGRTLSGGARPSGENPRYHGRQPSLHRLYVDYASCIATKWASAKGGGLLGLAHQQPSGLVYETLGYLCTWRRSDYEKALAFNTGA